jgi:DNA-binding HxlR family transcriptional regulator
LLIVRELLCGSRRFNDIRRGVARISRTVLSDRLQELVDVGVATRVAGEHGPEYALTAAGAELAAVVAALATWGQRWLARRPQVEDLDLDPLLVDMHRRVRFAALPKEPLVVRFALARSETGGRREPRFMLLKAAEASLCLRNPGFPEPLCVGGPLAALVGWWRGDVGFAAAQRNGLAIAGPRALAREFPRWFERYQFAAIAPATASQAREAPP